MSHPDSNSPQSPPADSWHRRTLEHKSALFAVATTLAISVGGLVEIVPLFTVSAGPQAMAEVTPYTPLEQAGRDIYAREGCVQCHSQMVRPFRAETLRYGEWSRAGEYSFDRPFLLGSRRIGPDLHRLGGKYPDVWHYEHMKDPRSTSPGSIMPSYPWLLEDKIDAADVQASMTALSVFGHYTQAEIDAAPQTIAKQGEEIVGRLRQSKVENIEADHEIVALIAYLQRLGTDGKKALKDQVAQAEAAETTGSAQ